MPLLFAWEVFSHIWINWVHELLRWNLFICNRCVQLIDMQQLRSGLLLWECGECMHCMSIWTIVTTWV